MPRPGLVLPKLAPSEHQHATLNAGGLASGTGRAGLFWRSSLELVESSYRILRVAAESFGETLACSLLCILCGSLDKHARVLKARKSLRNSPASTRDADDMSARLSRFSWRHSVSKSAQASHQKRQPQRRVPKAYTAPDARQPQLPLTFLNSADAQTPKAIRFSTHPILSPHTPTGDCTLILYSDPHFPTLI